MHFLFETRFFKFGNIGQIYHTRLAMAISV